MSYAFPGVPGEARAALAAAVSDLPAAYERLVSSGIKGFLLSTCLRIEVAVAGDDEALAAAVTALFGDEPRPEGTVVRHDADAVHHLFRIAAGLESPVVGEVEILAQFREAAQLASRLGASEGSLSQLLAAAVAAGRAARDGMPTAPHRSLAAVAAQLVGGASEVAVLGAGLMGRSVVAALHALPAPPTVTVYARRPEEVSVPGVVVKSVDDLEAALSTVEAVVGATSARRRLLGPEALGLALRGRESELLMVDLAMPPDFDPPIDAPVRYLGIDAVAVYARRVAAPEAVEELVAEAATAAAVRLANQELVGPVISELMRRADEVAAQVTERFAGRLSAPEDRELLHQAVRTAARSLLHPPVTFLNAETHRPDTVETLALAFGVEGDG